MRDKLILFLIRTLNVVIPFLLYGLGAYYGNYYYELYSNDSGAMSDMRFSDFCFCVMFLGMGLILWNLLLGILSFFKYFKHAAWFSLLRRRSRIFVILLGGLVLVLGMLF